MLSNDLGISNCRLFKEKARQISIPGDIKTYLILIRREIIFPVLHPE